MQRKYENISFYRWINGKVSFIFMLTEDLRRWITLSVFENIEIVHRAELNNWNTLTYMIIFFMNMLYLIYEINANIFWLKAN